MDIDEFLVKFVLALAIGALALAALGFGLLLLGDEIGLWQFDSGLGSEAGDGSVSGSSGEESER